MVKVVNIMEVLFPVTMSRVHASLSSESTERKERTHERGRYGETEIQRERERLELRWTR